MVPMRRIQGYIAMYPNDSRHLFIWRQKYEVNSGNAIVPDPGRVLPGALFLKRKIIIAPSYMVNLVLLV